MDAVVLAKTANRSTVGMLTEFAFLADVRRTDSGTADLTALAVELAATPCGPLYTTHTHPDRAVKALVDSHLQSGRALRHVSPDENR